MGLDANEQPWRDDIASVLSIPEHSICVVTTDVGDAFGAKGGLYPEHVTVAPLAWRLQRPIKWTESRTESVHATNHGRDQQ